MFLSRGDRDLRFVYQTHPRSQASPRGEGKDSALLSSRDGYKMGVKMINPESQLRARNWMLSLVLFLVPHHIIETMAKVAKDHSWQDGCHQI